MRACGPARPLSSPIFNSSVRRCGYAYRAGAAACIIYANTDSKPNILGSAEIPSLATDRKAGQQIIAALKAGQTVKIVVSDKVRNFGLPTAGTVSDFSSPGLDQELSIKPDFGGIGGQVYSTISKHAQGTKRTPYAVYSGTSMSSPYTAGVAALLLESYGRDRPTFDEFRTRLQNTALPQKKYGYDTLDSVSFQGAGLLNAFRAVTSKTVVYPSRLAFNDTKNVKQHYKVTVTNKHTVPIDYTVSHQPALQVTPFVAGDDSIATATQASYTKDFATILFSRNNDRVPQLTFTLAPGASRSFNVHVQPPANAVAGLFPIYSGYVVVSQSGAADADPLASVPYAGVVGSWRDAPIWSRKSASFDNVLFEAAPGLEALGLGLAENATLTTGLYTLDSGFVPITKGANVNGSDFAILTAPAVTNSRLARVDAIYKGNEWSKLTAAGITRNTKLVVYAEIAFSLNLGPTGLEQSAGGALLFDGLQRNSPSQGQSVVKPQMLIWGGRVLTNGTDPSSQLVQLPAGKYQLRFSALKHFGRVGSPVAGNDWDTVLTPEFNLVY
ncbi:hypothetical protein HDU96_010592 [Phlyctochytrium bullatum]|nr:hypothetical protein HDU96_010592 [Phlyctochytrium bullatum]